MKRTAILAIGLIVSVVAISLSTSVAAGAALTAADITQGTNTASETWQFAAQEHGGTTRFYRDTDYDNDPATWWGAGWAGWRWPANEGEGTYGNTGTGGMLMHPWNSGSAIGSSAVAYLIPADGDYAISVSITYASVGNGVGATLFVGEEGAAGYIDGVDLGSNGFSVVDPGDWLDNGTATQASPNVTLAATHTFTAGQYAIFALDNNLTWGADATTLNWLTVDAVPIPEPATLSLLAIGAIGMFVRKKRK